MGDMYAKWEESLNEKDYWFAAAMHLLFCRKKVEDCPRCQCVQKRLAEPVRGERAS